MIKTNYNAIPDELFENYLKFLVSKIYKILPMYEKNVKTLYKYLKSLQIELTGNLELISELKCDGNFQTILANIEYLISKDINHAICKKVVFDSIELVNKLQNKYK